MVSSQDMIKHSGEIVIWHKQLNTHEGWQDIVLKKLMDFFFQRPISRTHNGKKWKEYIFLGILKSSFSYRTLQEDKAQIFFPGLILNTE